MKAKELKLMPNEDLKIKIAELKKELIKFNAQVSTGTVPKNAGQIREAKKTIAKIMTVMQQSRQNKARGGKKETSPIKDLGGKRNSKVISETPSQKFGGKTE